MDDPVLLSAVGDMTVEETIAYLEKIGEETDVDEARPEFIFLKNLYEEAVRQGSFAEIAGR